MGSIFITGASGFIGSWFLPRVDFSKYSQVICLSRDIRRLARHVRAKFDPRFVQGDVCDAATYTQYLSSCETVVHLAAATGKAKPESFFATNVEGTRRLVKACEEAGVKNFVHCSTIAVKYRNKANYHYAQSKELAEKIVRDSRLDHVIVRPTIVIGENGSSWESLSAWARPPIILLPGNGATKVQPIHVEDLADCFSTIISEQAFSNEIIELGGPEQITLADFLKEIHMMDSGKNPLILHVPLEPLMVSVTLLERYLGRMLPISAGRLAFFANDSTIEENRIFTQHVRQMKSIEAMLRRTVTNDF